MITRTWADKDGKIHQEQIKPEVFYQAQCQLRESMTKEELAEIDRKAKKMAEYIQRESSEMALDVMQFGRPLNKITRRSEMPGKRVRRPKPRPKPSK